MGCGCGGAGASGRALMTSGDYQPPPPEPIAVTDLGGEAPDGAAYKVTTADQVAWFGDHRPAFDWQGANGGKLRTA